MPSTTAVPFYMPRFSAGRTVERTVCLHPLDLHARNRSRHMVDDLVQVPLPFRTSLEDESTLPVHRSIDPSGKTDYLGVRVIHVLTIAFFLSMFQVDFVRIINVPYRSVVSFRATILSRNLITVVLCCQRRTSCCILSSL